MIAKDSDRRDGPNRIDGRLLRHAMAARGYLTLTVTSGLVVTGLILAQASLLAHALATAARGAGSAALGTTLALLLAVVAGRAAATYLGEVAALRAAAVVKSRLRRKLAGHALSLGPAWLGGQRAGEITALATRGLDALDAYFARYLPQLGLSVLVPAAVLATVTAADWVSGLLIAVTLPLIPLFAVLVGLHTKAQTRRQWQLLARLGGHFLDVVQGLPTLKVFGRAKPQEQVIAKVTEAHRSATMATLRVAFLSALVLELAAAVATALVAVEVGLRLLYGHIGYQTALLVLLLTPEAYLPLRAVAAQFHASAEGIAAAGRVFQILDIPQSWPSAAVTIQPRLPSAPSVVAVGPPAPDLRDDTITLRAVTACYQGRDRPALDEVSLTIRPGERILLTGPSGAGKTTVLQLLLRFIAPASGTIEVGGADLAAVPLDAWRAQLAWVPQHPWLFPATVAGNIALGRPAAPRDAIEHAAERAGAAQFIRALPDRYDTRLGERAPRLSAGQRQKLALARAFLLDAPLVLLDEPTAHLDPSSAAAITAAIDSTLTGRTVILVSHRGGWAGAGGRTVALDQGRLRKALAPLPADSADSADSADLADPGDLVTW
jgi:ATP-binding cassette subfamily C protein CydD